MLCSVPASPRPPPCNYGGWEDLELLEEQGSSGKLDPFRSFLISAGIDRKHALVFFLGFLSALAVSRARFSSTAVLPVSVLVFVAGFSAGAARAGVLGGLVNQIGRKGIDLTDFYEKRRVLGAFLDGLDAKMSDLKSGLEGAIVSNRIEMGSIKNYLDVVEDVRSETVNTRKSMEGSIDRESGKKSSPKPSRKKREARVDGFDFVQYLSGMFEDYLIRVTPPKAKDTNKGELTEQSNFTVEGNPASVAPVKGSVAGNVVEGRGSKPLPDNNLENSKAGTLQGDAPEKFMTVNPVVRNDAPVESNAAARNGEKSHYCRDGRYGNDMLSYDDELNKLSKSLRFTTKQGSFEKLVYKHIYEGRTLQNDISDSADLGRRTAESTDFFTSESEASTLLERSLEIHNRSCFSSYGSEHIGSQIGRMHGTISKQAAVKSEDQSILDNQQPVCGTEDGNTPSSSTISADEEFNLNVKEATDLVKQARERMVRQADEAAADSMLYRSARLLSTAVALKPMSLLAVGQLGNTYLLHGELKLKISRELRTLLSRSDGLSNGKGRWVQFEKFDSRALSRENTASVLVDVCEECDGLLVEAGRKYRKALSIDGNDIRSLYNWGLALSFRAQLIADIGPEAAFDADKVYLAAIDKFNAMMSRSKANAPDALYRWGVALQQRSHLRKHNSREKIKLLQQAKSLFEDVLCVESDNHQVREALSSCLSELNYYGQW